MIDWNLPGNININLHQTTFALNKWSESPKPHRQGGPALYTARLSRLPYKNEKEDANMKPYMPPSQWL